MPLYGSQSGMPTPVYPGQQFVLFDGTETPALGVKSVAFERVPNWDGHPSAMTFTAVFPNAPTATVQIQASNDDIDANYQVMQSITTKQGFYPDYGELRFYRAVLSAYSAGLMPKIIVQR